MNKMILKRSHLTLTMIFLLVFSITITSCGDGTDDRNISIPGVDGPIVTLQADTILISFVFEKISLPGGLRYGIPKYPNSYVEISPDLQSGGTLMAFSIDLDDVLDDNLRLLDPQGLPGGRALPGVAAGRLPAIAFTIEQFYGVSVYLGPKIFGLFVPVDMAIGSSVVSARFYSSGTRVGNISLVGEDEDGENSGILLMLDMANSTKKRLKSIAKKY